MRFQAVHLRVSGLVQGVGFRYHAYRSAMQLGLTGWVKNLPDGSVETEAEGDRSALEEYIKDLKVGPRSAVVRGVDVKWIEPTGNYIKFDVRY